MFNIQDLSNRVPIPTSPEPQGEFSTFFGEAFADNAVVATVLSIPWLLAVLNFIWSFYVVLAFLLSMIMLALYVYASVRWHQYMDLSSQVLRDAEVLYDEHYRGLAKNSRLEDVYTHIDSDSPNDWKLAIIEADIILDDTLKQKGYAGNSLGERLRSISPSQLETLDDAWEAHKIRNKIAHDGADFVLTRRLAEETINRYRRVFTEFGIT